MLVRHPAATELGAASALCIPPPDQPPLFWLPRAGVAVSLLRAATKATLPATPEGLHASANLYFAIAAAVCLTCMLLYSAVLPRLAVVQRRRQAALDAALHGYGPLQEAAATSSSAGSGSSAAALEDSSPLKLRRHGNGQAEVAQQGSSLDLELSADDHNSLRASAQQQQQLGPQEEAAPLLEDNWQQGGGSSGLSGLAVARRIWRLALANALTFM